ncbi:MAG TPA: ester cyclase [Vicinamibacterales bacterium]|jgi:steroid delta-isomerase-like uncharacterized protein|nr:ester cyclase [Vicinamibacterales bacterium]
MTRDEIAAMFARREETFGEMDAAALASDYADDALIDSPTAGTHHGPAAAAQALDALFHAFADMTLTIEHRLIDANQVVEVLTIEGTNVGGLMGLPASGKHFRVPAVFIYELRGDKIARERRIYDFTGMLVQVGVLKARPA